MQQTLKDLLQHNHSFLLVPNPAKGLGPYYNLYVLYLGLQSVDKSVDSYINHTRFTRSLQKSKGIKELNTIDINDKNKIIVTLKDLDTEIDDVEWHKTSKGIELIINTQDKASKGVKVKYKSPNYDKIILIDFDTTQEINNIGTKNPTLMDKQKYIILSSNKERDPSYIYYETKNVSVGQQIYSFMKEFEIPINKTSATYLIAGIYHDTYGLTTNIDANTFKALSDLANQNADLDTAITLANNNLSLVQAKLYSYIFAHINKIEPQSYYSVIKDTLLINEIEKNFLHFDLVPLRILSNNQNTFICYEYKGITKFIFFQNKNSDTAWLSDRGYNIVHIGKIVKATTKTPIAQALRDIVEALKTTAQVSKVDVDQNPLENKTKNKAKSSTQINQVDSKEERNAESQNLKKETVEEGTIIDQDQPADAADPLAPATMIPVPLRFEEPKEDKKENTPLPVAD